MNFSAVDSPWIPVRWENGVVSEVGLREALVRAQEISELADPSPLGVPTQLRVLLAVVGRVFQPATRKDWKALYAAKKFDAGPLDAYFAEHRPKFELFGETPFYQYAGVTTDKPAPLSRLVPERVSGNNATLFDHSQDANELAYSPAEALRMLLIGHGFGLGGLLKAKGAIDEVPFSHPSATDAVIARGGTLWLTGDSLFETLMLNLVAEGRTSEDDKPCWEQTLDAAHFGSSIPAGTLDRFTYLSRMVRLIPETDETGAVVVRRMFYTQGRSIDRGSLDPMQCYRKSKEHGHRPVLISEEKACWRDLHALLQANQEQGIRAAALGFVGALTQDGVIPQDRRVRLHIAGIASDKAKVLLWRYDRVSLPVAFLEDDELVAGLANRLAEAEELAGNLWKRIRSLCWHFLAPVKDMMQPDQKNVSALATQLDTRRTYWARLETFLPELLQRLAVASNDGTEATKWWGERRADAAEEAMKSAIERLGPSPRAWRAAAAVSPYFRKREESQDGV